MNPDHMLGTLLSLPGLRAPEVSRNGNERSHLCHVDLDHPFDMVLLTEDEPNYFQKILFLRLQQFFERAFEVEEGRV